MVDILHHLQCRVASPRLLRLSPGRAAASRVSLFSHLSTSHNSLVTQFPADDFSLITSAISHDTLAAKTSDITDIYNVPFDCDIYALPVDMVHPDGKTKGKGKKHLKNNTKCSKVITQDIKTTSTQEQTTKSKESGNNKDTKSKRYSLPGSSKKKKNKHSENDPEPFTTKALESYFLTVYGDLNAKYRTTRLDSVRKTKDTIIATVVEAHLDARRRVHYIETSDSPELFYPASRTTGTAVFLSESIKEFRSEETNNNTRPNKKLSIKNKKVHDRSGKKTSKNQNQKVKVSTVKILSTSLKQSFCNLFRWRRQSDVGAVEECESCRPTAAAAVRRALPPLPLPPPALSSRRIAAENAAADSSSDFARSIEKVKDYGWYWGPLSVEAAEKVLSNEPDGSFIVRDSSDDRYIFTLTFKLNGLRHVRIEHNQGNFCFGGCTMFNASTIVEFIENAVETSRSGRYLFFLNLRPLLGPVRVQLLYPVSRFKSVQSLQHMCRFVILKYVRRDLVCSLPVPRRLRDYLSVNHYYSELLADVDA